MSVQPIKNFETSDLYFAAFLKAAKVPWKGCSPHPKDSKRVNFVFEFTPNLRDLQHAYFSRSSKTRVVALTLADEIKALKAMTHV